MTYNDFLKTKIQVARETGIAIDPREVNGALKPHQRDAVVWAAQGGRRALFESFGLGKTAQELELARLITEKEGGRALIVLPLGVRQEFTRDARGLLGWAEEDVPVYVRTMAEAQAAPQRILLTNYERVRDGDIDPAAFTVAILDEASVLRSFGSKTYQEFMPKFREAPYRFVCTATPSPNRYLELIQYAAFLGVMDVGQSKTRFFQRNSEKAGDLKLLPHMEEEFWLWVSTWALMITTPSDLGYADEGYALPELEVRYHELPADHATAGEDKYGQVKLIRDAALGLSDAAREKRDSIDARVAKMAELVAEDPEAHFILWHDLEEERRAIRRALPEAVEIYGSQELDTRERNTIEFSDGEHRLLATKKSLSGSGCNFQRHCHRAIFVGIDYNFNDFIQAIHRVYRFMQSEKVIIDIIYMESEREILRALQAKWRQHDEMAERMRGIVKRYGLGGAMARAKLERTIGVTREEARGAHYVAVNNDCVAECRAMETESVDLIVTSIPFSNHYEYTPSYNDFGHNEDNGRFFEQMDYLTPELLRVLKPGRLYCCHVKDRVEFGKATGTGMATIDPFHMTTTMHTMRHGFQFMGMITVTTDVVRENNQTYRLGWTEKCKDGTKMGVGCPEYVLLFRKLPSDTSTSYADAPVVKGKEAYPLSRWQLDAHAYWRSSGDRLVTREELWRTPGDEIIKPYRAYSRANVYDYAEHAALSEKLAEAGELPKTYMAIPPGSASEWVWDDVLRFRTLNGRQAQEGREKHICPMQLDIIERLIELYSMEGETVLDPFGGIMSVPVSAVKMGRTGVGVELNRGYWKDGVGYLEEAEMGRDVGTLFDLMGEG